MPLPVPKIPIVASSLRRMGRPLFFFSSSGLRRKREKKPLLSGSASPKDDQSYVQFTFGGGNLVSPLAAAAAFALLHSNPTCLHSTSQPCAFSHSPQYYLLAYHERHAQLTNTCPEFASCCLCTLPRVSSVLSPAGNRAGVKILGGRVMSHAPVGQVHEVTPVAEGSEMEGYQEEDKGAATRQPGMLRYAALVWHSERLHGSFSDCCPCITQHTQSAACQRVLCCTCCAVLQTLLARAQPAHCRFPCMKQLRIKIGSKAPQQSSSHKIEVAARNAVKESV